MPKISGAARDTQAKGRTKKLWKASSGKPNFFERAQHTLCGCTADPIFACIIIHNREQDKSMRREKLE
ncbi:hypothetical protein [Lunatibacter salilacus]|uniref:hypothetical protein n=1 Tax=Lunatibacter salilacus TaxID=2483804 RepID=UPI00131DDA17|nr:hypothetical protein [Lunatibacter salilacus]